MRSKQAVVERHLGAQAFSALGRFGPRPALLTAKGTVTFGDLAGHIERSSLASGERRLVAIAGSNSAEVLITYAAAMAHGHTVLMVPGDHSESAAALIAAYDPDVVLGPDGRLDERRTSTAHELHPDLALLLSTSGSTGSPRLVRLSGDSVVSNALAIADYLEIDTEHRALTTLPMHYCYGLSVVNSHLLSGAGIVATDWSVVDPCLWDLLDDTGATSFAGVPYTFDLLDRIGFADREHPSLRHVTQAGGKLAAQRVAQYAALGRRQGWTFVPMYGQTEATARMAYLPSTHVESHPHALGIPVPGGSFRLDPVPEVDSGQSAEIGELVYSGPNVMFGYAETPADLARGRETVELRTGDLARLGDDGMYEWVGRRNRVAKAFGLRIDLDDLERTLADSGVPGRCVAEGDRVQVFVEHLGHVKRASTLLAERCGLPTHAISGIHLAELPRTPSGKVDYGLLRQHAREAPVAAATRRSGNVDGVTALFAELLGRPATADDSFQSLRGDSLSYVELSVRLTELDIDLPSDWHRLTIHELAVKPARKRRSVSLDTSILVRALAIVLVLGTHADLWTLPGGAHLLLVVVGFNLFRFRPVEETLGNRIRRGLSGLTSVIVPSVVWIGVVAMVAGTYTWGTVLFVNGLLGSDSWTLQWQFWFLEAVVWTQLGILVLTCLPRVDRMIARAPFGTACVALGVTLAVRFWLTGVEAGPTERYTPSIVLWCFALGWAMSAARTYAQRLIVTVATFVAVWGFFGDPAREAVVIGGVLLLLWIPTVRVGPTVARVLGALASASLFIYLTHWQIYPHWEDRAPIVAVLLSLAVGISYCRFYAVVSRTATSALSRLGQDRRRENR